MSWDDRWAFDEELCEWTNISNVHVERSRTKHSNTSHRSQRSTLERSSSLQRKITVGDVPRSNSCAILPEQITAQKEPIALTSTRRRSITQPRVRQQLNTGNHPVKQLRRSLRVSSAKTVPDITVNVKVPSSGSDERTQLASILLERLTSHADRSRRA